MFGLPVAGSQVPYHYYNNCESIIIVIRGEAAEVIEGKEIPVRAGDVLFISTTFISSFICSVLY